MEDPKSCFLVCFEANLFPASLEVSACQMMLEATLNDADLWKEGGSQECPGPVCGNETVCRLTVGGCIVVELVLGCFNRVGRMCVSFCVVKGFEGKAPRPLKSFQWHLWASSSSCFHVPFAWRRRTNKHPALDPMPRKSSRFRGVLSDVLFNSLQRVPKLGRKRTHRWL